MTTKAAKTEGVEPKGYDELPDDMIEELMAGAPAEFSEPTGEGPVIEHRDVSPEPAILDAPAGKVILRNVRYINETVFLPVDGEIVRGSWVKFNDGTAICTEAEAEQVLARLHYVRREPTEGQVLTYKGFSTRDPEIYTQYVEYYNENLAG